MKERSCRIFAMLLFVLAVPVLASAADLTINGISDVQNNCQYFPNSRTYYCTEKLNWAPSGGATISDTDGVPSLSYADATFTDKEYSGTYDGANSPVITAGGNCAPKDAKIEITGICEGSSSVGGNCAALPDVSSSRGLFQKIDGNTGCSICGPTGPWYDLGYYTYWKTCISSFNFPSGEGCTASCTAKTWQSYPCYSYVCSSSCNAASVNPTNQGKAASGSCSTTTYYTPCTLNPIVKVNNMFFQYPGLVVNTSTVTLPLANFKPSNNTLQMSAQGTGKFKYKVKWTEVSAPGSCLSSQGTKAYHITSGSIYQNASNARIVEGTFSMKFDSASTDTSISLLKDDYNPVVSARISPYDAYNLKLDVYNGTWINLANNLQPNIWYDFSLMLNEATHVITLEAKSAEYPTISRTFGMLASPAIKWVSVSSNGAWLDNVNIVKKDVAENIISSYSDNFESYENGASMLYGTSGGFDNIKIANNLGIDSYDGHSVKSIVLKARNNLDAKSIYTNGVGCGGNKGSSCDYGTTGNIEIQAKSIAFSDLVTSCPDVGEPEDSNCGAATIKLKGGIINGNNIVAYGGRDCSNNAGGCFNYICSGRGGGSAMIDGNSTNIGSINLLGGSGTYPGPAGSVTISSGDLAVSSINVYGYTDAAGGSGGSVKIKGSKVNVTQINANGGGATSDPYCGGGYGGAGGTVIIMANDYGGISKIFANGGNGFYAGAGGAVRLSAAKLIMPIEVQANGAMGRVGTFGQNNYIIGTDASPGGSVSLYLDALESSVSVSAKGGNADCKNTGGFGYCALSNAGAGGTVGIFNDTVLSGSISVDNSGGNAKSCADAQRPNCYKNAGPLGNLQKQKRTWSGFIGLNASILSTSFSSYRVKVKDLWSGQYVRSRNNTLEDYIYTRAFVDDKVGASPAKKIVAIVTRREPYYNIQLGKEYEYEITASQCVPFDLVGCSHANDVVYRMPITQY